MLASAQWLYTGWVWGLCALARQEGLVWFGLVSFLQLRYKGLLAYTSVSKRTAQTFKKKSSLENLD